MIKTSLRGFLIVAIAFVLSFSWHFFGADDVDNGNPYDDISCIDANLTEEECVDVLRLSAQYDKAPGGSLV